VIPRTFPPAPGWSPDGHRIKAPLEDRRGQEKVWVYGALRERDGNQRAKPWIWNRPPPPKRHYRRRLVYLL
jgi:hypothetical protein